MDGANKSSSLSSAAPSNKTAITIAAAGPSIIVWVIAVYGAGVFRWGVASGLCVGLLSAGLTLKSVSFVQTCVHAPGARTGAVGGSGDGVGGCTAAAPGSTSTSLGSADGSSSLLSGLTSLTFEEFVFFLLLAPSLVCQPRFLKAPSRRPRSVTRAASEWFHAALTYLTVHMTCSTFFAPALRVLAAAFHPSWAAADGWAALRAQGSGGWLHEASPALADYFGEVLAGGSKEWAITVATAAFAGLIVLSPMMHFFMFYAFWHCVCLGSAELWGYPDRNTYGESDALS